MTAIHYCAISVVSKGLLFAWHYSCDCEHIHLGVIPCFYLNKSHTRGTQWDMFRKWCINTRSHALLQKVWFIGETKYIFIILSKYLFLTYQAATVAWNGPQFKGGLLCDVFLNMLMHHSWYQFSMYNVTNSSIMIVTYLLKVIIKFSKLLLNLWIYCELFLKLSYPDHNFGR